MLATTKQLRDAGFITGDLGYLTTRCKPVKDTVSNGCLMKVFDTDEVVKNLTSRIKAYRKCTKYCKQTDKKMTDILRMFKRAVKKLEKENGNL